MINENPEPSLSVPKIWRVNLRNQSFKIEDSPTNWGRLGGRGLIAKVLCEEVSPTCNALGTNNRLVFAPGLLVGHMLSSCDRISIGGKSPLTGGIKEANAGGTTGLHMARLGMKALIIEDRPLVDAWWILFIDKNGVQFHSADELIGLGVYEAASRLLEEYGEKVAISLIGPGGEMQMMAAGIQNLDKDNVPSRIAARGGLGAVMGSKRLKAIIFDDKGCQKPPIVDPEGFRLTRKKYNKALMGHPQTTIYREYGTAAMTAMCHSFGGLPTNNFSSGEFSNFEKISGEQLRELLLQRGGASNPSHACMPGCTIQCSNVYADEKGEAIVSALEYETISLMGSNLGIDDLDKIAELNWHVNDLGLDSIEIGATLGVIAEAGLMDFGDADRALELLLEIRAGTPLGRVLGNGAAITGEVFAVERVPVVKRQAMSAYEPRAIKGTGVTYATSPQGADHTCGLTIRAKIDHLDPSGQVELSRNAQINVAGYDSLGICAFATFGYAVDPNLVPDFLNTRYGWHVGKEILQEMGRDCLKLEREFNQKAGFTTGDDRLPEWMKVEQLPPHNTVFDVSDEELDNLFNW